MVKWKLLSLLHLNSSFFTILMVSNNNVIARNILTTFALAAAAVGAPLGSSLHDQALPIASAQQDQASPKGTMVIIGGGIPKLSLEELQANEHIKEENAAALVMHQKVMSLSPRQPPVVVCITAAAKEKAVKAGKQEKIIFDYLGAKKVHVIDAQTHADVIAEQAQILAAFKDADIIFMHGGCQEALTEAYTDTEALALIQSLYRTKAVVIAGTSAGAAGQAATMIADEGATPASMPKMGKGMATRPDLIIETHNGRKGRWERFLLAVANNKGGVDIGISLNINSAAIIYPSGKVEIWGDFPALLAFRQSLPPEARPVPGDKTIAMPSDPSDTLLVFSCPAGSAFTLRNRAVTQPIIAARRGNTIASPTALTLAGPH